MLSSKDILIRVISMREENTITFSELSDLLGERPKQVYSSVDKVNLLCLLKKAGE